MVAEAFGSPMVFTVVGTIVVATKRRSIGEKLAHMVQGRLFQKEDHLHTNVVS